MVVNYLKQVAPNLSVQWRNQDGKEHEIKASNVPGYINLVIVPDAGSNDTEEHKKLYERGIDVVIIDHHEFEKESPYAITVNNQDGKYPNPLLSATGVVHKVLQALDERLKINYADDYLDLLAIGYVSDMIPLISEEGRYYVTQGLNNIRNPFIKNLFKAQEFSTKGIISPTTVSFNIAPLFNATIRAGSMEEKDQLFFSLLDDGTTEVYYERGEKYESLIDNTIRMMKRVRQQQNKTVEESVNEINSKIKEKDLLKNKILIVEVSDLLDKNFTGLVANKLLNSKEVRRPVLLLRYNQKNGFMSGSGRGYPKGKIKDFRGFLNNSGYFKFAQGHKSAFGCGIDINKLIKFNDYINKEYAGVDFGASSYEVDFILNGNKVPKQLVEEIDENHFLWGQSIDEPLVAIEEVKVESRNINFIGKHKNHMKIKYKNVEYIKFFIDEEEREKLQQYKETDEITFNIIGKASVNIWRGNRTSQFIIEDYEIVNVGERELVF